MDPCPYLVKYSIDVLKKETKVFDIFNTDKKCFMETDSKFQTFGVCSQFI